MTHITSTQTSTNPLSYTDRGILTWDDCCNYTYSPEEIITIRMEYDIVWVKLTGDRAHPISRFMFRSILEAQRAAINKRVSEIIEAEAAKVIEAEREMSEIIHATAAEEIELHLSSQYDWLTEPIGTNPDSIFGLPGEAQAEMLPPVENAYHDRDWTAEGCEF